MKKGVSDRLWEDLVLAIRFDDLQPPADEEPNEWPGMCGYTISSRPNEDIISIWIGVRWTPHIIELSYRVSNIQARIFGVPRTQISSPFLSHRPPSIRFM